MPRMTTLACLLVAVLVPVVSAGQEDPGARWLGISDFARWSPDGSQIIFHSTRDGNFEIYVMRRDGSDQRRLTHNPWVDAYPDVSPDGTRVVFHSNREDFPGESPSRHQIYVMDEDGARQTRLTYHGFNHYNAFWAPDGTEIIFDAHTEGWSFATGDGGWEVMSISDRGTGLRSITNNPEAEDFDGTLSPDGRFLIFGHWPETGLFLLDRENPDVPARLWYPEQAGSPRLSPDGQTLVFTSERDGNRELYAIELGASPLDEVDFTHRTARRLTVSS